MAFQSIDYLIFLTALLALYWTQNRARQNTVLLLGSYFFYGYVHLWFLLLILTSTVVDYFCGLGMARFPARKRRLLLASLTANLGMLGIFKYFGFFAESAALALESLGLPAHRVTLEIVLPIGISFYTFQTMGYSIDVYRDKLTPRSNFLDYAVFVAFFPQLVAGPIERASRFLPQVETRRRFSSQQTGDALVLLVWGFFKKLVVADNVALIADKIFLLADPGFVLLWVGVFAFCIQIYADFSAYTDIARGTAKLFGFELMRNFEHPYISQTPAEFWRRWHISLSSWFRDYVYIPLGGRRVSVSKGFRNVMVTFVLSGLWHGASFNFALWGAYHGLLLVVYRVIDQFAPKLLSAKALLAPRLVLFFALTNLGWLLFREHDMSQLWLYLTLSPGANTQDQWAAAGYFFGLVCVYALPLAVHTCVDLIGAKRIFRGELRLAIAESTTVAALLVAMMLLYSRTPSDFIYFRF